MRIAIDARKIGDFGIGTYIRGLLRGLAESRTDESYVVLAPEKAAGVPRDFEHVVLDAPHYSLRELVAVGRAAKRARADLLHVPHYVVPLADMPVVSTIHDLIHLRAVHRNPLKPLYARAMLRRAVGRSARVLTVSEAVRDDLVTTLGCERSKIVVTPNGIDDVFRAEAPSPVSERYFLYAGNDKPHKNVDRLVAAFDAVRREAPDLSLVLAGGVFERHHAHAGVMAAGFVSTRELAALYRGAIALVQPSLDEGFGLTAAEAMASGTAVITSNAAALIEVTGDAALHADATSANEIARAMMRVIGDASLRETLARAGIERSRAFTWKRCAELTRRAYFDAAGGEKGAKRGPDISF